MCAQSEKSNQIKKGIRKEAQFVFKIITWRYDTYDEYEYEADDDDEQDEDNDEKRIWIIFVNKIMYIMRGRNPPCLILNVTSRQQQRQQD